MDKRHYAIYGGTFDPIHIGHLSLATHAVRECGIDKLIFMPAYVSPFKQDRKVTPGYHRVRMIEAVLKYDPAFCVSRYEIGKEGPSYTVETLRHWVSLLGGNLSFVLGYDSVIQSDTWFHGEEILRNYPLITARRPDTDDEAGLKKIQYLRDTYNADITVMEMEPVDASSSEIRRRVSAGKSLGGMVPPEVERYIIEHNLYQNS
ncbi:MAG: nicotinate (nicotinamide) nucleotide adenylyltransferase [Mogibacterium sp.]|nr:nicotinate (nicotinamide) nucleotide adenylyltransferase [Mogibacterium sp.]